MKNALQWEEFWKHSFCQITGQSSIFDMQNEKDFLNHYKMFLHNQDFEIVF